MSAKKKKSTCLWFQCTRCFSVVIDRDGSLHENDCPPNVKTATYPFIINKVLVCTLNTNKDNSVGYNENSSMIYISNIALQLCGIPVGDNVLITPSSGQSFVRKAWKDHDKQQLTAALHEKDAASSGILHNDVFTIQLLKESIEYANEITISCANNYTENIVEFLKFSNINRIYRTGNLIALTYYGKRITFKIVEIKCLNPNTQSIFFKISSNTLWRIDDAIHRKNDVKIKVGGLQDIIHDINKTIDAALESSVGGNFVPRGILLYGPSGTGKSLTMRYLATEWLKKSVNAIHIKCDYEFTRLKKEVEKCIGQAKRSSTFIILVDDLDVMGSKKGNHENEISSLLATFFDVLTTFSLKIAIIASCNQINNIDVNLRRPGRFDKEIEFNVPIPRQRLDILKVLVEDITHSISPKDMKFIADKTHGFVGADLVSLLFKATNAASAESKLLSGDHLLQCLPQIKPSAMREIMIQVPDVRWEDIGGQDELKHQLRQAVEWPLKYPQSFLRLGVSPPRGLLMYGPPGCSKTMVAKALATESGLNFISVKGPELFSKWVGESEKAVREVFRRARQAAPSIVFFDELDALAGERSTSGTGSQVQERVLAQLLTELDGVEALGHVIVIGATNRPDRLDAALLRPGRLDRVVYVPLPNFDTRLDIFRVRCKSTPSAEDVDFNELAKLTKGYSGAEICAVCNEAALLALNEDMEAIHVSKSHFLAAMQIITARTAPNALELCEQYKAMRII